MEKETRSLYIWMVVISTNIVLAPFIYIFEIGIDAAFSIENLIPTGITLFCSVVPILLASSTIRIKNYLGYGFFVLLLSPLPYFIYDAYHCTGKWCDLGDLIYGTAFGYAAFMFGLFYTLGILYKGWNRKFVLSLVGLVPGLIIVIIWLISRG